MNKEKVYVVPNDKKFNNTQNIAYGINTNTRNSKDIRKEIDDLFNSKFFIAKARVHLVINGKKVEETIIGKSGDNLITKNSKLLPISDITDIEVL